MSEALGAVRAMMLANPALMAAVPASRVVPGELPQDTAWPAVLLLHTSTRRAGNLTIGVGEELLTTEITAVPISPGYAAMADLVSKVVAACHGQRGVFDDVQVSSCLRIGIGEDDFIDEQGLWARPVVFELLYRRP